ncbi:hypothetical protein F4781DRAFT_424607 [Annulohypoxylon bovei var. microspora]|nr:hypothetical protein F4781DRAFT_424607 [Annulohypoxylon bovei var. microspora]
MATSTVTAVAKMAFFIIGLASIVSVASADQAITSTMQDVPDYLDQSAMELALVSDSGPGVEYKVAPLTVEAGLNQTNENALRTNYNNNLNITDAIAYLTCDTNSNDSYISSNDVLNAVMKRKPKAILLFSTAGTCCGLDGSDLDFTSIWTMTNSQDAWMAKNWTSDSTGSTVRATIAGNDTDVDTDNGQAQGGSNSAVAMSILYSITGLITLLFLIIIATGAIRAHRHPERYGPRASYGGRPRQSRAKGLARAVLETLPIVKFGDPQPAKPDPENELESIAGDRQQHPALPTQHDDMSNDVGQAGPSPEVTATTTSRAIAEPSVATTSNQTQENGGQTEEEHLGCSICTEDFSVGQDVRVLPCDHKFHPQCVDPWLVNVSGTCPLCRLDLRPHEAEAEAEEEVEVGEASSSVPQPDEAGPVDRHLAPSPEDDGDGPQRRRRSRFLDWNGLRHASVDERIQALRQYRQSQQEATSGNNSAEDQTRHARLSDRLREKFHVRTRAHPPSDSPPSSH